MTQSDFGPTRSVVHGSFTIENVYPHPPGKVFKAFASQQAKDRWFGGPGEWERKERTFDFRVGGRETNVGGPRGEPTHGFYATFQDIVVNERIVYTYDMTIGEKRISVSLATIEFIAEGAGTRVSVTENGVFLDGYDDAGSREHGTRWLMNKLGATLQD